MPYITLSELIRRLFAENSVEMKIRSLTVERFLLKSGINAL